MGDFSGGSFKVKINFLAKSCEYVTFEYGFSNEAKEIINLDNAKLIQLGDLATPIYSWYCTPPMKALLDRLVYGMNKYYGDEKGPSLWNACGKKFWL